MFHTPLMATEPRQGHAGAGGSSVAPLVEGTRNMRCYAGRAEKASPEWPGPPEAPGGRRPFNLSWNWRRSRSPCRGCPPPRVYVTRVRATPRRSRPFPWRRLGSQEPASLPRMDFVAHPASHEEAFQRTLSAQDLDLDLPGVVGGVGRLHGINLRLGTCPEQPSADRGYFPRPATLTAVGPTMARRPSRMLSDNPNSSTTEKYLRVRRAQRTMDIHPGELCPCASFTSARM